MQKIRNVVEEELIVRNIKEVLDMEGSGIKHMLDNDRFEELSLVYDLISRVDHKLEELKRALQKHVVSSGDEINKIMPTASSANASKTLADDNGEGSSKAKAAAPTAAAAQAISAIQWVDNVLKLKDKYDTIWMQSFSSDQSLQTALTRSFTEFINSFSRCTEYMSLFIDDNLKRGLKDKTEAEVDIVLDKAITLLQYVQDKDMFELYYKKHLAKRLLLGKSVSEEIEKQMISRMKLEVGNHFTSRLEGMFKDMALSEDLTSGYRQHITNQGDPDQNRIDLSINVLTSNYWPESIGSAIRSNDGVRLNCNWPPEIDTIKRSFTQFYDKERNGRQLFWRADMGTADVRATFPKIPGKDGTLGKERKHELNVPTYSMIILLLFNNVPAGESLTFDEIQAKTNIPVPELKRQMLSLAVVPKTRILKKEPMGKEINDTDRFFFNESFTSKFVKIKVAMVATGSKVEGDKERQETELRNDEMRGGLIEACVVRIMKYVLIHS
jgi:cullin 3